jgi:hypothetical protein
VETLTHVVKLPLGVVVVQLNRHGLELSDRGGFEVRWAGKAENALSLEDYRAVIKNHLRDVYKKQAGQEPSGITLNLASHQLIDDVIGWG